MQYVVLGYDGRDGFSSLDKQTKIGAYYSFYIYNLQKNRKSKKMSIVHILL